MATVTTNRDTGNTPDLAGNAGFAMLSRVLYLATRLVVPPLVLSHVTLEEYGLWSAAFVLIMYVGLTDVGFSNVYVRFVARYHAAGDQAAINRLLSTGIITLSLLAAGVFALLALALPAVLAFLNVDSAQHETARVLILGAAGMFLVDLSLGAYCYLLHGLQRIREEQTVAIIGYLLELAAIASLLALGLGIYSLLCAFVLRYLFSLGAFYRLAHRFLPGLRVSLHLFEPSLLRHFFGFGSRVQASALLGTLLFSLDRLVAGKLFGPAGLALLELGNKLPQAAASIPAAISNITMPAAARLEALADTAATRKLFITTSRSVGMVAAVPLAFLASFADPVAGLWLGDQEGLAQVIRVMAAVAVATQLHIMTGPASAIYRARGLVRYEFLYHGLRLAGLAAGMTLALVLVSERSVATLAGGAAGGTAVAALGYQLLNQRRLAGHTLAALPATLLPAVFAWGLAALLARGWQLAAAGDRWVSALLLASTGLLYLVLLATLGWRWLLRDDERQALGRLLRRKLPSVTAGSNP